MQRSPFVPIPRVRVGVEDKIVFDDLRVRFGLATLLMQGCHPVVAWLFGLFGCVNLFLYSLQSLFPFELLQFFFIFGIVQRPEFFVVRQGAFQHAVPTMIESVGDGGLLR